MKTEKETQSCRNNKISELILYRISYYSVNIVRHTACRLGTDSFTVANIGSSLNYTGLSSHTLNNSSLPNRYPTVGT